MSDQVRVNGNMLSYGSIKAKVDGDVFHGFSAIKYGDARERGKSYGMGRHQSPRGRGRGKYSTEPVVLTGPKSTMQELRAALAKRSPTGTSYGDVVFQLVVQYFETDDTPITVEIEDCVFTKNTSSEEEGPDPLSEDVELDCMRIRRNGMVLFDEGTQ